MPPSSNKRPITLLHRIEYLFYRSAETILRPVPLPLICLLGRAIGWVAWLGSPKYRRLVLKNLRIAAGEHYSYSHLAKLTQQTFTTAGANFFVTLKASSMSPEKVFDLVDFDGLEELRKVTSKGQGAILVMGHMGSWEVLTRVSTLSLPNIPTGGIYRPLNNPLMDRLIHQRRNKEGTLLFSKRESFLKGAAHLKKGGILVIMADQHAHRAGTLTPFFNRPSSCVPLPEILHRRSGCAIFSLGMKTTGLGTWQVSLKPIPPQKITTKHLVKEMETMLAQSFPDGFWFHNRWKLEKTPLALQYKKRASFHVNTVKPIRFLYQIPSLTPSSWTAFLSHCHELCAAIPRAEIGILFPRSLDRQNASPLLKEDLKLLKLFTQHQGSLTPHHLIPFPYSNTAQGRKELKQALKNYHYNAPSPFEFFINTTLDHSLHHLIKQVHPIPLFSPSHKQSTSSFLKQLGVPNLSTPLPYD